MSTTSSSAALADQALELFRKAGNPFRNYFARNPDDEVCARFHVAELFAKERDQLLGVVDIYRNEPTTHSEMVPILGNKGSGKTHLLHSIKHGQEDTWQLLVTPGTYQRDTDFLEYLLFQVIDTLLGGGKQKGKRPLEYVGEDLGRRLMHKALTSATRDELLDLFPAPGLGRWTRRLGLGSSQAQERAQFLVENLSRPGSFAGGFAPLRRLCAESSLACERACDLVCNHVDRSEPHNTAGLMRRRIYQGFARAALLGDESDLANFLTYGFAELDFKVRPSRQDLVLALFKVLMEIFVQLRIPVVVAFDQLEDLLLVRRNEDGPRTAEAFFAGIVQAMHQVAGICFLVFAERGLWNRFVPTLDGYIQDRLSNPIHVPDYGTIKAMRLEAPSPELVRLVVEARLRPTLGELYDSGDLPPLFPFTDEQVSQVALTEPTLRDMLQQFRALFDHLVYGEPENNAPSKVEFTSPPTQSPAPETISVSDIPAGVKSVMFAESPTPDAAKQASNNHQPPSGKQPPSSFAEAWEQELQAARNKLSPEGSLTGATRELQAGLGAFLQLCHEHGVKIGPWRLQHVVSEFNFGEHPTYGVITTAHWACKDGQPWRVGVGLFLGRGPGKPKDLETKLSSLEIQPPVIDHLILLRPEDDLSLTGKSKSLWQGAEKRGQHARLEAISLENFAIFYSFPRWLASISESLPTGQSLPNLADFLQDRCEKLLAQLCMPVVP